MCKSANVVDPITEVTLGNTDPVYILDTPNSDRARQQAKDEGLVVVVPTASQLQIDLDSQADYEFFLKQIATYKKRRYNPDVVLGETRGRKVISSWLLWKLRRCQHRGSSIPSDSYTGLTTCWYCGSTKGRGESTWLAPWIWRKK